MTSPYLTQLCPAGELDAFHHHLLSFLPEVSGDAHRIILHALDGGRRKTTGIRPAPSRCPILGNTFKELSTSAC